ncbi:hypothetical protein [Streptomyces sp. NBC_01244]|uniref:hypothetical protein n=1 Tax=Streptomyces sp. NBC_01244 TaxID=2903797 RepID=UPI002E13BC60|nr:hypothetical protein OG247_03740 [Streptomyces sp. NBC_01244]
MKGTHQGQRRTGRSGETARNCWDDFEAVRGQMDRLFGQRSRRTSRAEATSAVPEDDGGRRLG